MQVSKAQIRMCKELRPDLCTNEFFNPENLTKSSRAVFEHVFQMVAEALIISRILKAGKSLITSEGDEIVESLIKSRQGAVCLSGHIGCFELLAAYHVSKGVALNVIARYPNISLAGKILAEVRKAYGVKIIWRDDKASGRQLYGALQEGQFLAALIDQDINLKNNFADFFGLKTSYPIMPIVMAVRSRKPVLASFIIRTSICTHKVITKEIPYDENSDNVEQEILEKYNTMFEELVAKYPQQWIWWHKRWRRRPEIDYTQNPEKLLSTRQYVKWVRAITKDNVTEASKL